MGQSTHHPTVLYWRLLDFRSSSQNYWYCLDLMFVCLFVSRVVYFVFQLCLMYQIRRCIRSPGAYRPFWHGTFWQESFRHGCFITETFWHVHHSALGTFWHGDFLAWGLFSTKNFRHRKILARRHFGTWTVRHSSTDCSVFGPGVKVLMMCNALPSLARDMRRQLFLGTNMGTFQHGNFSAWGLFSTRNFWHRNISAQGHFGAWTVRHSSTDRGVFGPGQSYIHQVL